MESKIKQTVKVTVTKNLPESYMKKNLKEKKNDN